jgi:ATP-dependent Clp protease adapter protein ClpS
MSLLSKIKSFLTPKDNSIVLPREVSLATIEELVPSNFKFGIEIYNDNTTPMEFVIKTLTKNLKIKRKEAIEIMLKIHAKGGAVLSLSTFEDAKQIADTVMSDARKNNHELFCRAVSAQQDAPGDAKKRRA